jgi:phenylpropionate dioxygenase-like ring-hydroxylating dioxygenase large terminal subunit
LQRSTGAQEKNMSAAPKSILTDVAPGAPMHEAMKRYWLPACLSNDVPEPDSDPIRLTMLDESYVCFRDTAGKVGILDENCCHRGASLCLGRVGNGGVQCIYHGWRYAVDGTILETPNVADSSVKERLRQPAYPVREVGGIIFVYLGPEGLEPPFPTLPFADLPAANRYIAITVASSNYTQVLEGLLDSSHVGVLHTDVLKRLAAGIGPMPVLGGRTRTQYGGQAADMAPKIEIQDADFGFRYAAIRQLRQADGEIRSLARVTAFAFPGVVYVPPGNIMLFTLPVKSDLTHTFHVYWDEGVEFDDERLRGLRKYYGIDEEGMREWGLGRESHHLPSSPNRDSMWHQDRAAMRRGESFTGLYQFMQEDCAVAASMGPIQDLRKQHLVAADMAVIHFRKVMVRNAEEVKAAREPGGLQPARPPEGVAGWTTAERPWQSWFSE